jgi:hypothetical protein
LLPDITDQLTFKLKRITTEQFLSKDLASKALAFDLEGSSAMLLMLTKAMNGI